MISVYSLIRTIIPTLRRKIQKSEIWLFLTPFLYIKKSGFLISHSFLKKDLTG